LLEYDAIQGFIYVLTNEHMPNLVKIGMSRRPVEERVKELSANTGVPSPFEIQAYYPSTDPEAHEASVHQRLEQFRVPAREFFKCDVRQALSVVRAVCNSAPIFVTKAWRSTTQVFSFCCPECQKEFSTEDGSAGYIGRCPHCQSWIETE